MAHQQYDRSSYHARIARANAGQYIKRLRTDAGLTQKDLSEILKLKYYTFISQVENGQGRLPPNLWVKTAKAVNVEVVEFALDMLNFYDPHAFNAINGREYNQNDNDSANGTDGL
jgi:transcriptional regulator with XRE-family HTH domain